MATRIAGASKPAGPGAVTGFGGFKPEQLGSTAPADLVYDPAAGSVIDSEHPEDAYAERDTKAPTGGAVDRRVSFELTSK
jgi:hypothetical protein